MKYSKRERSRMFAAALTLAGLINGIFLPGYSLAQTRDLHANAGSRFSRSHDQPPADASVKSVALSPLSVPDQSVRARVNQRYGDLPLSFEANRGQSNAQIKFLSRGAGYNLFLTSTEAVLALRKNQSAKFAGKNSASLMARASRLSAQAVLCMKLVNANPRTRVAGQDELPGRINYLTGNDPQKWHRDVAAYGKVKYENVYPGVDMIYYGNHKQLEYDFVVAPGADPKTIRLAFKGADDVKVDAAGELVVRIGGEEIRQRKPVIYQETNITRREIAGRYVLNNKREVGFEIGAYDATKPLVIDPVLVYATYFGGSFAESHGIAVDAAGSAYVTGLTNSDYPTTPGAFKTSGTPFASTLFVSKLSPDGSNFVYSTFIGGSGSNGSVDIGKGIAVDAAGNAYVTGFTTSTDFPTRNAFQEKHGGGVQDAFVAKLNAAGSDLLYSSFIGGSSFEMGNRIAVDSSANAYVTGRVDSINSSTFPTTPGALRTTPREQNPSGDGFVAKINTNASGASSLIYSTYCDASNDIAADPPGNAYVAGGTLVLKLNSAGTALVYSFNYGSTNNGGSNIPNAVANGVAVDSSGNAYVTGFTFSPNFPTRNAFQGTYGNSGSFNNALFSDAFISKINPAGTALLYSTYLGGTGRDAGASIAVDAAGNAYVTGTTLSSDFPVRDALQEKFGGGDNSIQTAQVAPVAPSASDAFIAKINTNASGADSLVYSTYFGVNYNEAGVGIAVDTQGSAYVTGSAQNISVVVANIGGGANTTGIIHTGSTPVTTPVAANNGDLRSPFILKIANSSRSTLQFSAANYSVAEGDGNASITVTRTGDTSNAATVDYATYDGTASERSDYTTAFGTLRFAPGEASKIFTILITDDNKQEGNETLNLILRNQTPGTSLGRTIAAALTINDNDAASSTSNPIDDARFFVRQHYVDFLNRLPDAGGLDYWTNQIAQCGGDERCIRNKRIDVSAAFFIEQEFQQTGAFIYRFYIAAYQRRPNYAEFTRDRNRLLASSDLEASRQAFAEEFVQRPAFALKYPQSLSRSEFVDALIKNVRNASGLDLSNSRASFIADYDANNSRARVVRLVVDNAAFAQGEFNRAFVLAEYFGYLRRDPDEAGYQFWVNVLNNRVPGNYRAMACAFLTSREYQERFGSVVTRSDASCGQP
ncbi:MAG: SBBP repeat-containing protein [Pyrinomonadaceae bacterium]